MSVHDTKNPESREDALQAANDAVRAGQLIVLPTDTVYGVGADAFSPEAVDALLAAKGRGRDTPPPVLVGDHAVLLALAVDVPDYVERLAEEFWPGPLTLILTAQPSLTWDLGETRGTVALRMPDDEVALELLRRTGPLAVSSANRHGRPAALTVLDAATQLGDAVEIYLDGGLARIGTSSTIIDTTVEPAEIVREGALTREQIIEAVGDIFTAPATADGEADAAEDGTGPSYPDARADAGTHAGADADAGTHVDVDADRTAAGDTPGKDPDAGPTAPTGPGAPADLANPLPAEDTPGGGPVPGPATSPGAVGDAAAGEVHSALQLPSEPDLQDLSSSQETAPVGTAAGEAPLTEPGAPTGHAADEGASPRSAPPDPEDDTDPGARSQSAPG